MTAAFNHYGCHMIAIVLLSCLSSSMSSLLMLRQCVLLWIRDCVVIIAAALCIIVDLFLCYIAVVRRGCDIIATSNRQCCHIIAVALLSCSSSSMYYSRVCHHQCHRY